MQNIQYYIKEIQKVYKTGHATEHSYRPALKDLIESFSKEIIVTNEPKRENCGAPDYIVTKNQIPLGYIEAKDIGKSLDNIEKDAQLNNPKSDNGKQLKRYLEGLNNLILTDYLEFRWFVEGDKRLTVKLADIASGRKINLIKDDITIFQRLIEEYLNSQVITISTPKDLAQRMASIASIIKEIIITSFMDEDKGGTLHEQYEDFKAVLLHGINTEQFADMYAQTICYGLFSARCNPDCSIPFNRKSAVFEIPNTNPFLKKMFNNIAGQDLDLRVSWAVDDLAELLNKADISGILSDFGKRSKKEDPVVHFYETFLSIYDPDLRNSRGVYYTPEPVVSYIVKSIDGILKKYFKLQDGLADSSKVIFYKNIKQKNGITKKEKSGECHKVLLLDPAVGTGTFLFNVIKHIQDHFIKKGKSGMWTSYIAQHLLPRMYGFELLVAPYTVAHMKLALQLKDSGYDFQSKERLNIILTNTLEEAYDIKGLSAFARWVAEEANKASKVKQDFPVMVILGNPPYSYQSENIGEWISNIIKEYYLCDGMPLGEKNPKGLQDDYVKFIRFSQLRIEQTGYGILAFITNHNYLDGPTFRGMRYSLVNTFDDIYILNLHGNSKIKEVCPDGVKDENVFDIQQGVAINIFVKRQSTSAKKSNVYYSDVWGVREIYNKSGNLINGKYHWLYANDIFSTQFKKINPITPNYLLIPESGKLKIEYEKGYSIKNLFPINSVGLYTARDRMAIQKSPVILKNILKDFVSLDVEGARDKYKLGIDSSDWKVSLAQKDVKENHIIDQNIKPITYRPFDIRYTFYSGKSGGFICRPRPNIMRHLADKSNKAICYLRRSRESINSGIFIAKYIVDKTVISSADNAYVAPLYTYLSDEGLFNGQNSKQEYITKSYNISKDFINHILTLMDLKFKKDGKGDLINSFGPEDVFAYTYSILYSKSYRKRYKEYIERDYPRIPITSNKSLFGILCELGHELIELHLMERYGNNKPEYPIDGNNSIDFVDFRLKSKIGCIWINDKQYFEEIPASVWNFQIGGYQVCEKWLKDRKGQELTYDDLDHYCNIISIVDETISIMGNIDKNINDNGGWPLK